MDKLKYQKCIRIVTTMPYIQTVWIIQQAEQGGKKYSSNNYFLHLHKQFAAFKDGSLPLCVVNNSYQMFKTRTRSTSEFILLNPPSEKAIVKDTTTYSLWLKFNCCVNCLENYAHVTLRWLREVYIFYMKY